MRHRRASPLAVFLLSIFAVVVALTIAVGATAATTTHSAVLANTTNYQDSTGEDPNSLDIGAVTVSNDDTGLVTFDAKFINGSLQPGQTGFFIVLDTDRDESTGSPGTSGGDYSIDWWGPTLLEKWNGSDWDFAPSMKTLVALVQPNGMIVKVNASELGGVTGFDFYVKTYRPNPSDPLDQFSDWAPDFDKWSYDVKLYVAPAVSITSIKCSPDPAVKGKTMVGKATVKVTRAGQPETLPTTAKAKWTATLGSVPLRPASTSIGSNGVLLSTWKVPKAVKAKVMRVTVSLTVENVTVTKTHVHRIK